MKKWEAGERVEYTDALGNVRHGEVVSVPDSMRAGHSEGTVFVSIITVASRGRRPRNPRPTVVHFEPHEVPRLRCQL